MEQTPLHVNPDLNNNSINCNIVESLINNLPQAIVIFNNLGIALSVNTIFYKMFDIIADTKVSDITILELYSKLTYNNSENVEHANKLIDGFKNKVSVLIDITLANNKHLNIVCQPINNGDVVCIITDISARKNSENELRLHEERMQSLFSLSQMSHLSEKEIISFALEESIKHTGSKIGYLHFINSNQISLNLFMWSRDTIKQCTAETNNMYPLNNAGIWADCFRLRKPVIHNNYPNAPDKKGLPEGHIHLCRHMSIPVFDGNNIVAIAGVGNKDENYDEGDTLELSVFMGEMWKIIKRKRTEIELRDSEDRYRQLSEASQEALIIHNNGHIIDINTTTCRIFGYYRDELIGNSLFNLTLPENFELISQNIKELNNTPFEATGITKDKNPIFCEFRTRSILYNNETLHLTAIRDISTRKLLENELIKAKNIAEIANRSKSEFLANISHEIRTPMNAVLGFAELLMEEVCDPKQKEYVKGITYSGKNMLNLINDLLDLSKIEAGKLDIHYEPVNIREICKELGQIFFLKLKEKNLQFNINISNNLPHTIIFDGVRLRQILLNLVGNAVKFTEIGKIELNIINTNTYPDPNITDLKIEIIDTGIGIPDDDKDLIFEAFRQRNGQSNRKYGGTGLGLTITKRLVTIMNGDIFLLSELNKGTKFIVEFKKITIDKITFSPNANETIINQAIDNASFMFLPSFKTLNLEVKSILENNILPMLILSHSSIVFDEINSLANNIIELGNNYNIKAFTEFGTLLASASLNFDYTKVAELLSIFKLHYKHL